MADGILFLTAVSMRYPLLKNILAIRRQSMGKYKKDKELQIPMEQRQNLNEKILYLVENHEAELYRDYTRRHF